MDSNRLQTEKAELIARHGPWTSENIRLSETDYTLSPHLAGNEVRVKRVLRVLSDLIPKPLFEMRILDLGSLEGGFSIELARQGAEVVAVEGRAANAAKIEFAKRALNLDRLTVETADVRSIDPARHGQFDAILNMGVLYHLPEHDLFNWMQRLADMCRHLTFVNTHYSLHPERKIIWNNEEYWGRNYQEHKTDATPGEREKKVWASLDNVTSFWLTRPSLYNLLQAIGFTSVYEVHNPATWEPVDRITLVGLKGRPLTLLTTPPEINTTIQKCPEEPATDAESITPASLLQRVKRKLAS